MSTGADNTLSISWHDSAWIPVLSPANVMDYFAERSNPFYDRTCNNEIVKMQRLSPDQLGNMTGVEYILLHVQEPILYVIRKQDRHSPSHVTAVADYYVIAGVVYQAPDLCSVINSRMLNTMHSIQAAFTESLSFSKYHPSKGYWWEFKEKEETEKTVNKDKKKKKEEPSSVFQRQRVDDLLVELSKKYPLKVITPPGATTAAVQPAAVTGAATAGGSQGSGTGVAAAGQETTRIVPDQIKSEKMEIKVEKTEDSRTQNNSMKPPPDKKAKLIR